MTKLQWILLLNFCSLFSFTSVAQEEQSVVEEEQTYREMGGGGLSLGYGNFGSLKLRDFVPGTETFNNDYFTFGFSSRTFYENLYIGFNVQAVVGGNLSTDTSEADIGGGWMMVDFGYLVVDQPQFKMYPSVGVGAVVTDVSIHQTGDLSLQQVRQNYAREINISKVGFGLDIGLNLDFLPKWHYDEEVETYSSFLTGLKVGYLLGFAGDNWRYSGGKVNDGPDYGMQGFYLQLLLGGYGTNQL